MDVLAATPTTIDVLKKAQIFLNQKSEVTSSASLPTPNIEADVVGGSDLIPARVIEGDGVNGYICDIYEAGLNEIPTSQGKVFLANGNSSFYSLPMGTILFVQKLSINVMGSGE